MESSKFSELASLRRSTTQRRVFFCLIRSEKDLSAGGIAKELDLSVNAVNLALFHLHKKGLIRRIRRGYYSYNLGQLLVAFLSEYLGVRKRRR